MVFKIGFTHCPHSRLRNPVFGYLGELQKWERMVIVFASSEAVGPAFLEAALIQKYKGTPGCRNERDGGETVKESEGPYFTYFVYQSFKRPSNAHLIRSQARPLLR
ncbi:unnamed protein product [Durusdinium trenchii]|uniref:Uncharacterized protein n=1 Tax=Durusdinium trenchii TaxID=1381693 RepID=A0ABP0S2X0_9DINO